MAAPPPPFRARKDRETLSEYGGYRQQTKKQQYYPHHLKTSEYGSADPSPTNQYPSSYKHYQQQHRNNNNKGVRVVIDNSFDNTDYTSDSDAMPSSVIDVIF